MNETKPEDVMRALECCSDDNCNECPYREDRDCVKTHTEAIFAIIREKEAEIERLKAENALLENGLECALNNQKQARADAITEFAERVKTFYRNLKGKTIGGSVEYHIEQIAKEMREKQ